MDKILCCDWGSSNFRLFLADSKSGDILATFRSDQGISRLQPPVGGEVSHEPAAGEILAGNPPALIGEPFVSVLKHAIKALETETASSLQKLPLVISGMASSTFGILELPYTSIPFDLHRDHLHTQRIAASDAFPHEAILVSGIATQHDVMRGEETKMLGAGPYSDKGVDIYLLPGTHSKQVFVEQGRITGFRTFLTGELFSLLQSHGILASAVDRGHSSLLDHFDAFKEAVLAVQLEPFLSMLFRLRTNIILEHHGKEANYWYLSGLLIGEELKSLRNVSFNRLYLSGGDVLEPLYLAAMEFIGFPQPLMMDPEAVLVRGQLRVLQTTAY